MLLKVLHSSYFIRFTLYFSYTFSLLQLHISKKRMKNKQTKKINTSFDLTDLTFYWTILTLKKILSTFGVSFLDIAMRFLFFSLILHNSSFSVGVRLEYFLFFLLFPMFCWSFVYYFTIMIQDWVVIIGAYIYRIYEVIFTSHQPTYFL